MGRTLQKHTGLSSWIEGLLRQGIPRPTWDPATFSSGDSLFRCRRHLVESELRAAYMLDWDCAVQVRPFHPHLCCWTNRAFHNSKRPYGFNVPYRKLFQAFEDIVARHQGRPHWAKAHRLGPDSLRKLYPHFDDFTQVIHRVDPDGIFRNQYIQRHIMGKPVDPRIFKQHLWTLHFWVAIFRIHVSLFDREKISGLASLYSFHIPVSS